MDRRQPHIWKAWYADGSVYSSKEHSWVSLPKEGCVGIVVIYDDVYSEVIHQGDWYYREDKQFHAVPAGEYDGSGTFVEAPEVACGACLKKGQTIPDEQWEKVHAEMMAYSRSKGGL